MTAAAPLQSVSRKGGLKTEWRIVRGVESHAPCSAEGVHNRSRWTTFHRAPFTCFFSRAVAQPGDRRSHYEGMINTTIAPL